MKKKVLTVLLALVAAFCLCFGLAACGDKNNTSSSGGGGTSQEPSGGTQTETGGGGDNDQGGGGSSGDQGGEQSGDTKNLISFKTLTPGQDYSAYGKVSNDTEGFSFADEITVTNGASYAVYTDLARPQEIENKVAPLAVGNNTFYIFASRGSGFKIYTVTLRRRPVYTVNFATEGSAVSSQQVEEDSEIASPATTEKTGYTFRGWKLNGADATFPYKAEAGIPYEGNYAVTFNAAFTANEYKVTLDAKGGEVTGNEQTVTYDNFYNFPVPTRRGYTFAGWYDGETQLTNAWGQSNSAWNIAESKNVEAHWTFNKKLYVTKNIDSAGAVSGGGNYDFGDEVTVTATTYLGYTFLGWYDDEDVRRSTDETFTYSRGVETSITAQWKCNPEMEIFRFTSDEETCVITGVQNRDITQVTIPDYVTEIGSYAFGSWSELTSIVIPDNVTSIKYSAFDGCKGLTKVTIGKSVTEIGNYAFRGCLKLIEVWNYSRLPLSYGSYGGIADYAKIIYIDDTPSKQTKTDDGYLFYENGEDSCLFGYAGGGAKLTLPTASPSGKSYQIYQYAFQKCDELTSVTIGDGVTSIGKYAFEGCSGLTSIEISDSVTEIGEGAFENCSGLTSVTIGRGVTSIGSWAFEGCNSLTDVTFEDPNNWNENGKELKSEDLQNSFLAAQYLCVLYYGVPWTRQ